jgi:hypothetical protein
LLGSFLLDVLHREIQLVGGQLLGAAAEAMTQQLVDQGLQFLDLRCQLSQLHITLQGCRHGIANHALQRNGIFRQGSEIELHSGMLNNGAASLPELFCVRRFL